jgi:hypothetical protein
MLINRGNGMNKNKSMDLSKPVVSKYTVDNIKLVNTSSPIMNQFKLIEKHAIPKTKLCNILTRRLVQLKKA